MDMKNIGKWSYLGGLGIAIVAALAGFSASWLGPLVIVLAVLAGLFFMDTEEVTHASIRYLALAILTAALDSFPAIGPFITTIAEAMLGFFGPLTLTVLLVFNYKQAMAWMNK